MGRYDDRRPSDSAPRQMYKVVCSECKEDCEVPFMPRNNKPVYCSKCFEKHDPKASERPQRRSRDFDKPRRDSGRPGRDSYGSRSGDTTEMHDAICDNCGTSCKVPFRPTGEKPVFCKNCFSGAESGKERESKIGVKAQLDELTAKVDLILEALKLTVPVKDTKKDGTESDTISLRTRKTVRKIDDDATISLK